MATMSISVVKGRGSMAHNNREFSTQNVDKERTQNNIIYKAEPIEQAYNKLFQEEDISRTILECKLKFIFFSASIRSMA